MSGIQLVMFSVNFAFVLTNLYGWLLKRFYVPTPFKDRYNELFPAHKLVATLCLLQLYELPYLFCIGDPSALFYVNATGVMFFSAFSYVLVKGYFFLERFSPWKMIVFMHPIIWCWIVLLLPVLGIIEFTKTYQMVMLCAVSLISASYVIFHIVFHNKLHRQIIRMDESEYSNASDFPLQFAKRVEWLPLFICVLLYVCFVINHPIAKIVRDVLLTVVCGWFVFYTLNPHRPVRAELAKAMEEEESGENEHGHQMKKFLSQKKRDEMEEAMMKLLEDEKLYLADHFTMTELVHRMGTNKRYLNEVISQSRYDTFYNLINTLRIDNACRMLKNDCDAKLETVALASGFSSGSAFSQVFKKIKGITPREYIEKIALE